MNNHIFLGRQPVFDKTGKCIAYELLYRGQGEDFASFTDDTQATARVIINLVHNLGVNEIIGNKLAFVNIDDHMLLSETLLSLPKEHCILEILEYTKMSVAILGRIQMLHEMGYRFALDDFCCKSHNIEYFKQIMPFVEIVKIDFMGEHDIDIESMAALFKSYNVKLLAEKVETKELYERCKNAGFEYFQGYFFEKPSIIEGKKIEPGLTNIMELINTLCLTSDIDVLTEKFSLYPELTYNLLHYINSAAYRFTTHITSIRQVLLLLGPSRLRSWLCLFMYAGGGEDILFQEALFNAAKFRSKFMQETVKSLSHIEMEDEAFLVGSLSLIDTYLEIRMEDILDKLELSEGIKEALILRKGYFGKLLQVAEKLETTDQLHRMIEHLSPKIGMSANTLYKIYLDALSYAQDKES